MRTFAVGELLAGLSMEKALDAVVCVFEMVPMTSEVLLKIQNVEDVIVEDIGQLEK